VKSCRQRLAGIVTNRGFIDVLKFTFESGELPGKEFRGRIYYRLDDDTCDPETASCSSQLPYSLRADAVYLMMNYRGEIAPPVETED